MQKTCSRVSALQSTMVGYFSTMVVLASELYRVVVRQLFVVRLLRKVRLERRNLRRMRRRVSVARAVDLRACERPSVVCQHGVIDIAGV